MSRYLDKTGLSYLWGKIKSLVPALSEKTTAILYGTVDSTSTATVFTATVDGLDELVDGTCIMLKNGVVTSASGFTINVNGLGAKPCYSNMATGNGITPTAPTRETTIFNINYTMIFVYSSTIVEGGGWICYRGYDNNTNTIGYQLRTNSQTLPMKSVTYRYRLLFTSADGKHFVPANNSSSTNATASRTVCQDKIDPFGNIYYYGTTASVAANARPSATYLWNQYTLSLGYSFNRTGSALTLTSWAPVYVKCAPQTDGSAIIDSTTPYVQTLPTTDDGKIYIFLGVAYSATNIELVPQHPVYYFKDGQIRLYTNQVAGGGGGSSVEVTPVLTSGTNIAGIMVDGVTTQLYAPNEISAYNSNPAMDGTAYSGSSDDYARGDHVHPSDTSKANVSHTHTVDDITDGHIWINLSSDPFLSIEWSTSSINWHHSAVCMDLYGNPNDGYTLGSAGMLQLSTIKSALSMGGNSVVPVLRIYASTQSVMVDEIAYITGVVFTSQTTGYIEALNITRDGVFHRYEIYLDITNPYAPVVTVARNNVTAQVTETDPTVPAWAKASTKPSYDADEITYDEHEHQTEYISHGEENVGDILEVIYNGKQDVVSVINKTSSDTSNILSTNTFYVFPEMSTLSVAVTSSGMYGFRFESGATATTLTVTGATMPDSFTVEANKVYEINIYQGYGVASSWTVS